MRGFARGQLQREILDALKHAGPMPSCELAAYLRASEDSVSKAICRFRNPEPGKRRQVRVCRWEYEADGKRDKWRSVFALGFAPDAERPASPSKTEKSRRYREQLRQRAELLATCSSVWAMASAIKAQVQQPSLF